MTAQDFDGKRCKFVNFVFAASLYTFILFVLLNVPCMLCSYIFLPVEGERFLDPKTLLHTLKAAGQSRKYERQKNKINNTLFSASIIT